MLSRPTILLFLSALALTGCVERTITITSEPSGALVWLNDREVGRTPLDVDFLHYGEYDVRLEKPGYEPLMTSGLASPPWWDSVPLDLLAEVSPADHHAEIAWHYDLAPAANDRDALIDRARTLRQQTRPIE